MSKYTIALDVPANTHGRDLLLGDLHGCYEALMDAMVRIGFDPAVDRIFAVGDLIDRGPHSLACINLLREPWFYSVQGNHENMMLAALKAGAKSPAWRGWMANGGEWFAKLDAAELQLAKSLLPYVAALPITMTVELRQQKRIGISHAQPPRLDWRSISEGKRLNGDEIWRTLWGRDYTRGARVPRVSGVDATVHGHTIVGKPLWRGNMHFIDTGAFLKGKVQLVEINETFLQASALQASAPRLGQ